MGFYMGHRAGERLDSFLALVVGGASKGNTRGRAGRAAWEGRVGGRVG